MYIKPKLTDQHKLNRIRYVLEQVVDLDAAHPVYRDMFGHIHIDEKWFYILTNGKSVLVAPDEELPDCPEAQHKSHILKGMFMSVCGRGQQKLKFTGLCGVHECTKWLPALRNSVNRPAGTLVETDVSVTSEYYRETMETRMLPQIIENMPWAGLGGHELVIQHDGAPAHNGKGNEAYWPEMLQRMYPRRKITIITQPAQSPDLNINDLGFFNSLQSLAADTDPENLSALMDSVEECYWNYDAQTLERVWQAQFNMYNCILQAKGGNNYAQPHTGVSKRQRRGELAVEVKASKANIEACRVLVGM